ncbi:hypothetical protein [Absidia glauca]|uniref:IPT/TIG domain-containing protein n=1 Tax=Absidia glauca TaxID=4829 RepID=A0A163K9P7_ABSGL|nr:hypothetical protein [Absidia glauca]
MSLYVLDQPHSPTSPTRTSKTDANEGMESLDYLDPLFPDIISSHFINDTSQLYMDRDMPSPSSSSISVHDLSSSSSTSTTPSPHSQYDVLQPDLLLDKNHTHLLPANIPIPESYHQLTTEYYARSNSNVYNANPQHMDPTQDMSSSAAEDSLQIRVLGIPSHGAKSRVETQIKLCIQLLSSNGTKVSNWPYLRLPEYMLARSKLRKNQQQKLLEGSVATMVSDESKVLTLEAKVICSTDSSKDVRMCPGCVRRERKRAERTKDGKPRYELDSLASEHDSTKGLVDNSMEQDRDRILLFNCSSVVNFSSGDAILPTRITCYCRHHNEKVGFRIEFVMRNDQGLTVAKGCSPPIMITDDHKSSKQQQRNGSISGTCTTTNDGHKGSNGNNSRKRGRSDYENQQTPDTPAPSRRGSFSDNNASTITPLHLNPSASFIIPASASTPYQYDHPSPPTDGATTPTSSLSSSPQAMLIGNGLAMPPLTVDNTSSYLQNMQQSIASIDPMANLLNMGPLNHNNHNNHNHSQSNTHDLSAANLPTDPTDDATWPNNRRRRVTNNDSSYTPDELPMWRTEHHPQLERLVPAQGPTYGGVEVTILGSGFYRGLSCLFGEHAATTVYWNPNTLVCVLPPAATPGPVVVSFKEHPIVLEGQDVALFTYYDASDQALLELALQVVGLKMTGKLHDAKHIAMLIVRGDQQRSQQPYQQQQQQQQHSNTNRGTNHTERQKQQQQTITDFEQDAETDSCDNDDRSTDADSDDDDGDSLDAWTWREGDDLEKHIINALAQSDAHDVMQTNPNGHTMLHLAVFLRYGALTKVLLDKMDRQVIDQSDRNGCTALHFACLQNNLPMVHLLLAAGAQPTEKSSVGSTLELATDGAVQALLLQSLSKSLSSSSPSPSPSTPTTTTTTTTDLTHPPLPRRLSFKSHVRRFYTLKQQRGRDDETVNQTVNNLDHNGLGFAQYKHDRRLYVFWLPLLIVTIGLLYYQILGDRTLLTLLQDMIPFRRHGLHSIVGY